MLDLKANPEPPRAPGTIVEAQLDKGKGITATVLVQKGTLRVGDPFLAGIYSGKVRAMYDERGNRVEAAGPSTPGAADRPRRLPAGRRSPSSSWNRTARRARSACAGSS